MSQNEVKLIITTNNTGAISGIRGVTDSLSGMTAKVGGMTAMLKSHWLEFSALSAGVFFSVRKLYTEFAAAAEREEKRLAFTNLAATFHTNAEKIIADLKRMSGQSITTSVAIESAGRAMLSGLDPRALPGLMEFSKTITKITGDDVVGTFESLTRAIITGQDRMLRMQGISVDFGKAQKELAASLGGTTEQLNEQQMQYANLTALLATADEMTARLGKDMRTMSDDVNAMAASISEYATTIKDQLFTIFGPVGRELLRGFAENLRWIVWYIDSVKSGVNWIVEQYQRVKGLFGAGAAAPTPSSPESFLAGKGITSMSGLGFTFDTGGARGPGLESLHAYTEEMKSSLGEIAQKETEVTKSTTNQIQDREQAYKNMYEALRFDTERYYGFQKGLLEQQRDEEIAITGDLALAWEAFHARLQALDEQRILRTNDFVGGIKVFYAELEREGFTWASGAKGMMEDFASGGASALSGFLDSIETDTKNIGEHLKNFITDFADAFRAAVNRMISEWLMFTLLTGIGSAFGGMGSGSAGVNGTAGTTQAGGWGGAPYVGNMSPQGMGVSSAGGATMVQQTVQFNVSTVDGADTERFFRRNAPIIQKVVGDGVNQNRAFAAQLRGNR